MKWMILIFLNFLFCAQLVGQVSRPDRNLLRGETYVIEVPKGWKRPSAVHSCNDEPLKRVNGKYETTKFMRVYSKRKDRCGAVLTIMEIQKCASFQEIFTEDSIWASTDTTQVKVIYKSVNSKNGLKRWLLLRIRQSVIRKLTNYLLCKRLNGICRGVKMYIISVLRLAHCF